jgi:virginiamycin A acetyltransferase
MDNEPNPNDPFPVPNVDYVTYVRPTVADPKIIAGEFTYYSGRDFAKQVTHHYDFYGDRLIIGKFCQIAADVEFVMNGANHRMNCVSTFPFYIFRGWDEGVPPPEKMPSKGDTVIGNDVWIGQCSRILPGVHIGDGAIIGMGSTVGSAVEPYTIVAGNPAKLIRKRFDGELIALLLRFKWWDRPVEEIQKLIPLLHSDDLENVKSELKRRCAFSPCL